MIPLSSIGSRSETIMLEHLSREYNINRVFLCRVGFWPFQSTIARNLLRAFCLLLEISYCPFEILLLYDHRDDAQMIFEASYQLMMSIAFIVRTLNVIWYHDKLRWLYKTIDEHWNIFTNEVEVRILKDYSLLSRKFAIYYSTLMYIMTSGFIIIPLTPVFLDIVIPLNASRPRNFAVEVDFRVDKDEYFVPIFCYTTAVIVVGISIMVGVDTMHIACTAHACSLFSAISEQIENIILKVENNNKISDCGYHVKMEHKPSSEEIIYREYIICLKKHQLAIEFVNMLNSTYQVLSLLFLIILIAALSLVGIRIIYVLDQMQETIRFMFIIIGALVQLMIICYSSQKLMDESQNLFYRAYAAEWYNFSPRIKSLLIITLYRSSVSCRLMAGNMLPLSMTTYTDVVRMGMSYFTAFLSLKD